jgi:hypothetical protein
VEAAGAAGDRALARARELLAAPGAPSAGAAGGKTEAGYIDLLGGKAVASSGRAQDLMVSGLVPRIYERWWRPALGRLL